MLKRRKIGLTDQPNHTTRTVAYLRVSTDGQDLEKNKADILHLANEKGLMGQVEFVEEKVSGRVSWKERKIKGIIDDLGKGDNLIVSELSRLGRSMLEIMEILSICKQTRVNIYAVKGNWSLNGMQSELLAMVFAMAAEIERDLMRARTKEALRARKAAGVKLGRPKGPGKSKLDKFRPEIEALLKNGSTQAYIAKRYGSTPANLCLWLRKRNINAKPVIHP
jgi:DNA invertase Pin-like site-specific DNA recombinase